VHAEHATAKFKMPECSIGAAFTALVMACGGLRQTPAGFLPMAHRTFRRLAAVPRHVLDTRLQDYYGTRARCGFFRPSEAE